MSGYAKPSHTQVPNFLLDSHMSEMGEAELKVVLAVTRKTLGWHKKRDRLSFSQLVEITGLSRQGVADGTAAAIQRGVVARYPVGNSYEYELVVSEVDQPETVSETDHSGQPSRPKMPKNGQPSRHTKVNKLKETSQKKDSDTPSDFWEKELSPTQELTRVPFGEEFEEPKRQSAKQRRAERDAILDHPAIQAYRRQARLNVDFTWREAVANGVGTKPEDVTRWEAHIRDWIGAGWKKTNVKGMLESFQNGGIRQNNKKREDAKSRYEGRMQRLVNGN